MININNEDWRVLLVSPIHPMLIRSDGSLTVGVCDDPTKTIYIDETLDDFMLERVLLHELTHAAMFSYNVELTVAQEELLADLIATYGEEIVYITNKIFSKIQNNNWI